MSNFNVTKENLTAQVYEVEALQSVFPEELKVTDHGVLADINDFISNSGVTIPPRLEYSVAISTFWGNVELDVSLPQEYPNNDPEVYVRGSSLDRASQLNLNKSLTSFIDSREKGEPIIYELISWLQDNAGKYLTPNKDKKVKSPDKGDKKAALEFSRYWVYSHHIYSKIKRKEITEIARENSLTGFCLAGKPGIICVEGALDDCEYWWQQVKLMNWHRILVKFLEKEEACDSSVESYRKFSDFQEITFPTSERHNDMGLLLKYLTEHDSQHVFKELFGLEGKTA